MTRGGGIHHILLTVCSYPKTGEDMAWGKIHGKPTMNKSRAPN